jgi:putative membrane protein
MIYFWIKAFHIIFVISWFAGLFYLPRIFVNLAMAKQEAERDRLLLMAQKLFRFMMPLAVLALALGTWLWLRFNFTGMWLMIKLSLVLLLVAYHLYCGRLLRIFRLNLNKRGHVWFRWFNEIPVLLMVAIVILVVIKPIY